MLGSVEWHRAACDFLAIDGNGNIEGSGAKSDWDCIGDLRKDDGRVNEDIGWRGSRRVGCVFREVRSNGWRTTKSQKRLGGRRRDGETAT
jgi:hypothetical protein